ncbi:hypothetical protein C2G38_2228391 [Gigaspora rosea]|uniref:Uncharacterized protein n=1 Tax=Gigaspora rosea TaxID=44941 RepID=A0A397TZJ5_9GLOM|nr:hypothetical protein C2G38_2228391 [Gigaspora rosea]
MTLMIKRTKNEIPATMTPMINSDNSISIRPPAKMSEKYKRPSIRSPERPHLQTQDHPQKQRRNIKYQIQRKSNSNINDTNNDTNDNTNDNTNYNTNYNNMIKDNKLNK